MDDFEWTYLVITDVVSKLGFCNRELKILIVFTLALMLEIVTQWLPSTLRTCTNSQVGIVQELFCCRTVSSKPSMWGKTDFKLFVAADICLSVNH